MIIDIHTHTFPDAIAARAIQKLSHSAGIPPFSDGTEKGLINYSHESGIDLSVILPVATSPGQVHDINESSARINECYGNSGLFSIGAIHPDCTDYKAVIKKVSELGLKGLKIHPVFQGVDLDDIKYLRIMSCAAEHGLFVITHTGYDIGYPGVVRCSPEMARNVWKQLGSIPLVLGHMGGWGQWDVVPELLSETGFMLDTSFSTGILHFSDEKRPPYPMLDKEAFMKICEAFGPERILFGTDSPWSNASEAIAFINELPLAEDDKNLIFSGNAKRLL